MNEIEYLNQQIIELKTRVAALENRPDPMRRIGGWDTTPIDCGVDDIGAMNEDEYKRNRRYLLDGDDFAW